MAIPELENQAHRVLVVAPTAQTLVVQVVAAPVRYKERHAVSDIEAVVGFWNILTVRINIL